MKNSNTKSVNKNNLLDKDKDYNFILKRFIYFNNYIFLNEFFIDLKQKIKHIIKITKKFENIYPRNSMLF